MYILFFLVECIVGYRVHIETGRWHMLDKYFEWTVKLLAGGKLGHYLMVGALN